ncbi:alpha/beta fold hydrolase [Paraburkholderia sp. MMS20-SJTR3]|uniref:Alpha/beta fold hydrolase n=1 Tax=Paraburkholderia sejongensis TaxID=2886946 RepID=A0ABS8K1D1_9BURK|nr:alpha/beta fold hydrolase [Paraburkholderia sp. MMS20-SJTR3]MCC8395743.1 alpha/beta fold hydrolase [Paraburkholderia sp. MMS20-SJTR3]
MNPVKSIVYEAGQHAVLLLHGLSSSPLEMRFLARALYREGYTVIAPTFDGYSAGTTEQRMEAWLAAAVSEFDALKAKYHTVSICGLSIGATLAIALAAERPAAAALILLSVTLEYDGWAIPWYRFLLGWAWYTPLRHRWRYREGEPYGLKNEALRAKIARAMQKDAISEVGPSTISLPALHEASRLSAKVRRQLPAIKADTLIIHAIDDETASPLNARFVDSQIGASFLRTIYLDDSYHMITSDNEREIVAREIVMFLRESDATRHAGDGTAPVVSKALARRLRQIAAVGN